MRGGYSRGAEGRKGDEMDGLGSARIVALSFRPRTYLCSLVPPAAASYASIMLRTATEMFSSRVDCSLIFTALVASNSPPPLSPLLPPRPDLPPRPLRQARTISQRRTGGQPPRSQGTGQAGTPEVSGREARLLWTPARRRTRSRSPSTVNVNSNSLKRV